MTTACILTGQQKFDNYKKLLLEACQTYDAQSRSSKSRHCAHKVLLHQFSDIYDIQFNANTDIETLMAYCTLQNPVPTIHTPSYHTMAYENSYVSPVHYPFEQEPHSLSSIPPSMESPPSAWPDIPPAMATYAHQELPSHAPDPGTFGETQEHPQDTSDLLAKLHRSQWNKLTPKEQVLWDQFSPESKRLITMPVPCRPKPPPPTPKLPAKPPPHPSLRTSTPGMLIYMTCLPWISWIISNT